jgi:hypothetical protein
VDNPRLNSISKIAITDEEATTFLDAFLPVLRFPDNFRGVSGGSETLILDPLLSRLMSMLTHFLREGSKLTFVNQLPNQFPYLALKAKQECVLKREMDGSSMVAVVLSSEAKGIGASFHATYVQLLGSCGNSALEMYRLGLEREQCVVPGISCSGSGIQIVAVHLIPDLFPNMTVLTPCYDPNGSDSGRMELAKWLLRTLRFVEETDKILNQKVELRTSSDNISVELPQDENIFLKPVVQRIVEKDPLINFSNNNLLLNNIMRIYYRLSEQEGSRNCILFPYGVVNIPGEQDQYAGIQVREQILRILKRCFPNKPFSDLTPCLVYKNLSSDQWINDIPPVKYRKLYLEALMKAILIFNAAEVAHLDLRFPNIFWNVKQKDTIDTIATSMTELKMEETTTQEHSVEIQLQITDFEFATIFNQALPDRYLDMVARNIQIHGDSRFPVRNEDRIPSNPTHRRRRAAAFDNFYFFESAKRFLAANDNQDLNQHFIFMGINGDEILNVVKANGYQMEL